MLITEAAEGGGGVATEAADKGAAAPRVNRSEKAPKLIDPKERFFLMV